MYQLIFLRLFHKRLHRECVQYCGTYTGKIDNTFYSTNSIFLFYFSILEFKGSLLGKLPNKKSVPIYCNRKLPWES